MSTNQSLKTVSTQLPPLMQGTRSWTKLFRTSPSSMARKLSRGWVKLLIWRSNRSQPAPSRSTSLLELGGIPYGRISEIYGPESSGKSTLCQFILASVQRKWQIAAYIDLIIFTGKLVGNYETSIRVPGRHPLWEVHY